jgi:uncharacterized protein (TIGR00369 family)
VPRVLSSAGCVVCGRSNPAGLGLAFRVGPGRAETTWTPRAAHAGFDGLAHGGVILAVLDDAMWYAAYGHGALTLTAEARVRYRRPVPIGRAVRAVGVVVRRRGRLFECRAELCTEGTGERLAEAEGKFLEVPEGIPAPAGLVGLPDEAEDGPGGAEDDHQGPGEGDARGR